MNARTPFLLLLVTAVAASSLAGAYTGGGTFVVKTQFGTLLDNGGVVCHGTSGDGIGGGCLPFPAGGVSDDGTPRGGFVQVLDDSAGREVAFQVCLDNNGDGVCGGPASALQLDAGIPTSGLGGRCPDQIFFSHDDEGKFHNPLGPLPTSLLEGCAENGGFQGYVVLLCQGAHEVGGAAHTHEVSSGSISLAREGSGYGTFCGGGFGGGSAGGFVNAAAKAYTIV